MIGSDDPPVVQAEATGEVERARQATKVGNRIGGGTGEALVVIGAKAGEHGVGLFQRGGLSEAKFADQAILTGAPGALDAALGLGGAGGDLLDTELVEGASELGGRLFSGELFGEGPMGIVALEDAVAVERLSGTPCVVIMRCKARRSPTVFSASSWK